MPLLKLAEHYFYILSRFFRVDSFFRPFRFALCHSSLYQKVKYKSCEKYISHNLRVGGCGDNVTDFTNRENLAGADLVLWYGISFHHIPRDEDEAFMHAHWDGFQLIPRDWTAHNPLASNLSPTAVMTATPLIGPAPLDVIFDASKSTDPDGELVNFQWDFDDGVTGVGVSPAHRFEMTGTYTVTLTVTDNAGAEARATETIRVPCTLGDVNCDGQADAGDALFILQYDVDLRMGHHQYPVPQDSLWLLACDINGDHQCGATDALQVLQCSVGISNAFCQE
ncbi:PKD domain-containing protein [Chloroflexi bacterium TSY]|nr:PKD domain-containing protein [Chloroflexi bacterium TSY]